MNNFEFSRATDVADAVRQIAAEPGAAFVAGGTNLIDLIKEGVTKPSRLVDITQLQLNRIEDTSNGGLRIGALVPNSDLAYHPDIAKRYPLLASAILAGASPQLRNMATTGGNLLQRTRCFYFYDTTTPCNKREPGSGCSAIDGLNRMHAILGASEHCIATHPSDMCVALAALEARVLAAGRNGERSIAFADFHRLPGDTPQIDSNLNNDEIITAVELPRDGFAKNYSYLKIRDRLSYAFALVSVAAGLEIENGVIRQARLALGGVAHKPWRDREAEAQLSGAPAARESFTRAAETLLSDARGFGHNNFKIELARRAIMRALSQAASGTPQSQIGRFRTIHTAEALAVSGVLDIFTHAHRPKLASSDEKYGDEVAPPGSPFRPLYDDQVRFSGQPVALVVAEDPETARFAASLIRIDYHQRTHTTDLKENRGRARAVRENGESHSHRRGNAARAFDRSPIRIEVEYQMPVEHHNPMEMFGATAIWEGDGRITVYDKTQGPLNCRNYVANVFAMSQHTVRVLSPYVGGAFGSGLRPQYELPLAVLATRALRRSVQVTLTRQQMFTLGYRAGNIQSLALATDADGKLTSWRHEWIGMTSQFENFQRSYVTWSSQLYKCDNVELVQKLVKLDYNTPCDMRAPGGAEGLFAIECAMDELAYAANLDPLAFRLLNYSDKDQIDDKPYSSKELRECYHQGAERFGWSKRSAKPRSMTEGNELVGWGMASGIWEAMQMEASAKAVLTANGSLEIASATADIGPGTYTTMTQIAAEMLGVPIEHVTAKLGDSGLPRAPVEGGSFTTSSVGCAIQTACRAVRKELLRLAQKAPRSPLVSAKLEDVTFADDKIRHNKSGAEMSLTDAMRAGHVDRIEKEGSAAPKENSKYAHYTHSAIFAEVKIDEQIGVIRVTRVVNAVAAGRILNPKTAGSQILGAVVGGIGMALHEETLTDNRFGRFMTHNLADYHVPVNADVHAIDVIFVDERDDEINPLGVKGVGEIGIVGTAAAIANAIYHATGKRVRDLPITLDKLLRV